MRSCIADRSSECRFFVEFPLPSACIWNAARLAGLNVASGISFAHDLFELIRLDGVQATPAGLVGERTSKVFIHAIGIGAIACCLEV